MEKAFIAIVRIFVVFCVGVMIYVEAVLDMGMAGTTSLTGITFILLGPVVLISAVLLFGFIKVKRKTTKIIFAVLIVFAVSPLVAFCYYVGSFTYEEYRLEAAKKQKLDNWIAHTKTLTYSSEEFGISFSYASVPKSGFEWIPEGSINDGVIGETIVTESANQIVVLLKYNDPMFERMGNRYDVVYRFIKISKKPNISTKEFLNSYVCNLIGPGDIYFSDYLVDTRFYGRKNLLKLSLEYDSEHYYEGGCEEIGVETYYSSSDTNEKYHAMETKFSGVYNASKGISLSKEEVDSLGGVNTVFIEYPNNTGDILAVSGWSSHGFGPVEGSLGIDEYSRLMEHLAFNM